MCRCLICDVYTASLNKPRDAPRCLVCLAFSFEKLAVVYISVSQPLLVVALFVHDLSLWPSSPFVDAVTYGGKILISTSLIYILVRIT